MKTSKILVPLIAAIVTFFMAVIIINFIGDEKKENIAEPTMNPTTILDPLTESNANVGEYVFWGQYEQDNNTSNGKEDIEWLVLDKQDNKILVVSKYALDCKQYHEDDEDVTWEDCTLRTWLNNDFINTAFSEDEKAKIPTVTVVNNDHQEYDTDGGNDTQDKVFLLSIDEVNKYFDSDEERKCGTTDYAKAQGAYTRDPYTANGKATCACWLRSPGSDQARALCVFYDGYVRSLGGSVDEGGRAVRPALWISLES